MKRNSAEGRLLALRCCLAVYEFFQTQNLEKVRPNLDETVKHHLVRLDQTLINACSNICDFCNEEDTRQVLLRVFQISKKTLSKVTQGAEKDEESPDATNSIFNLLRLCKQDGNAAIERAIITCFTEVRDVVELGQVFAQDAFVLYEAVLREWKRGEADTGAFSSALDILPLAFCSTNGLYNVPNGAEADDERIPFDEVRAQLYQCLVEALQRGETFLSSARAIVRLLQSKKAHLLRAELVQCGAIEGLLVAMCGEDVAVLQEAENTLYWLIKDTDSSPCVENGNGDEVSKPSLDPVVDMLSDTSSKNWVIGLRVLCVMLRHTSQQFKQVLNESVSEIRLKVIKSLNAALNESEKMALSHEILVIQILEATVRGKAKEENKVWEESIGLVLPRMTGRANELMHKEETISKFCDESVVISF